jgi:hypothetical protein
MPSRRPPTLAQRHAELRALGWPGSTLRLIQGRELRFGFRVAPTAMSREYRCLLKIHSAAFPELFVVAPDLKALAAGRKLPHVYPHDGVGTKLCLWLPKAHEWCEQMRLDETYLPWAAEWLDYFEEWLVTNDWAGGGEHPQSRTRRWAESRARRIVR